jgi:hypothetical protein
MWSEFMRGSGMPRAHKGIWPTCCTLILIGALLSSAAAQDVRGVEKCTAEAQMERRTGCLQANVEFLQQALTKLQRETREKLATAAREAAADRAEIATLKSTVAKLTSELASLKPKDNAGGKK